MEPFFLVRVAGATVALAAPCDLERLSPRENAFIGVGVAAAIQCLYCTYFQQDEVRFADVSEAEIEDTVSIDGATRYFSTVLHGNEYDDFVTEVDEIFEYLREQPAPQIDD